jgi:tetratricopeptide (TPR) repeat protein
MWQIAAIALLFVALVAGGLAFILSRRSGPADNGSASPISISDQKQLVAEKLAEAATLMTAGEYNHAVEVLRMAVKLDPANADAHLRLGEALDKVGSRNEAIEEFRAATQSDPNSIPAWRALAAAQFEERLYSDAAESYRRLVAANGSNVDDPTWLAYADALRFAGRTEEARSAYQKVASSTSSDVARSARKHLAEIGPPAVAAADQPRDARSDSEHNPKAAEATASPTPAAVAQSTPAVVIAGPQIDFDSYYFQAVNIVNGRDPRQIERADLLRALTLFQRAAQGGSHRAEAQAFVNRLGREYDRRKKW